MAENVMKIFWLSCAHPGSLRHRRKYGWQCGSAESGENNRWYRENINLMSINIGISA